MAWEHDIRNGTAVGKYFVHIETARIKYFEAMVAIGKELDPAFDADGFIHGRAVGPILASTSCKFIRPCTYPDTLHTFVSAKLLDDDRFAMDYTMFSDEAGWDVPVAKGEGVVVTVDYAAAAPARVPVPAVLRDAIGRLTAAAS